MDNSLFNIIKIMFIMVPILAACIFIFTFAMMFSPKLRSKFMSNQIKSTKYMLDENEDMLKEINTKVANISKDGIEITARAIKKGFVGETIYCKHCGTTIDADSKFCKFCGKSQ